MDDDYGMGVLYKSIVVKDFREWHNNVKHRWEIIHRVNRSVVAWVRDEVFEKSPPEDWDYIKKRMWERVS